MYKSIVFTGPESSGKTFLAHKMAKLFNLLVLPEQGRIFLETFGLNYTLEDLNTIAKNHIKEEEEAQEGKESSLLIDTDLITIAIWSKEVFGTVSDLITNALKTYGTNRVYLLCKPDIPWEFDPQRENELDRHRIFSIYEATLQSLQLKYFIISGNYKERLLLTEKIINKLL